MHLIFASSVWISTLFPPVSHLPPPIYAWTSSRNHLKLHLIETLYCLWSPFSVTAAAGTTKVVSGTQTYPPIICGENAGQHMYIDAGRAKSENILISHSFSSTTTFDRKWNIKVTQIPCDSLYAPPSADCLQYFTGLQDTIYSYNFGAPSSAVSLTSWSPGLILKPFLWFSTITCLFKNTEFASAKRRIDVASFTSQPPTNSVSGLILKRRMAKLLPKSAQATMWSFLEEHRQVWLARPTVGPKTRLVMRIHYSIFIWFSLQNRMISDRFCAAKLSCATGDTEHRGVLSTATPFGLYVVFDDTEAANELSGDRGFALNYRQELCWNCIVLLYLICKQNDCVLWKKKWNGNSRNDTRLATGAVSLGRVGRGLQGFSSVFVSFLQRLVLRSSSRVPQQCRVVCQRIWLEVFLDPRGQR